MEMLIVGMNKTVDRRSIHLQRRRTQDLVQGHPRYPVVLRRHGGVGQDQQTLLLSDLRVEPVHRARGHAGRDLRQGGRVGRREGGVGQQGRH